MHPAHVAEEGLHGAGAAWWRRGAPEHLRRCDHQEHVAESVAGSVNDYPV